MQFSRLNLLFALAAAQEWNEPWRPQFHQSTPLGWGNDPNGMVFDGSRYHLFYQHYPDGLTWGPMHWGHSSSEDLLTWEHHPVAIKPAGIRDDGPVHLEIDGVLQTIPEHEWPNVGMAFSGSAYLDAEGRFGQGQNAIILMWTDHTEIREPVEFRRERQSMGYLLPSEGYSTVHHWDADAHGIQNDAESNMPFYEGTEMRPARFESDIRDPKIIKYDDTTQLAILANCDRMVIYSAPLGTTNQWVPRSAFGVNNGRLGVDLDLSTHDPDCENRGRTEGIWGRQGGVWECPDLIKMPVQGEDKERWVMIVSIGANNGVDDGPNTGSATMYFVGTLEDNFQFKPEEAFDAYPKWVDHGPDSYAGVTYGNTSPPLFQAWMSNWLYANEVPTGEHGWRSGMTLPRELSLVNRGTEKKPDYRLIHKFVDLTPVHDDDFATEDIWAIHGIPSSHPIYSVGAEVTVDFIGIDLEKEGEYTISFYGKPTVDEENVIQDPVDYVQVGLYIDSTGKQEFRVIRSSDFNWDVEDSEPGQKTPAEFFEGASVARAPRLQTDLKSVKMHAVFDTASVEVLFDDGEVSMTSLSFPLTELQRLSVVATTGFARGRYAALRSTVYEHTTSTPFPTTTSPTTTLPQITETPPTTTEPVPTPAPTCPAVTCPVVTCPEAPTCPDCSSSAASPLMTASIGMISAAALYLMA